MTLDATGDEAVTLQLDSGDGSVDAALSLMDVIDLLGVPTRGLCLGQVGGPVVGVLAVCPRRTVSAHARVHLSEPRSSAEGVAHHLTQWAAAQGDRWDRWCERVASASGTDSARLRRDTAAGRFLGAAEAVAYGIADEVAGPDARIYRLPGPGMGFGTRR
jgi:ATP-dependent Clp protease protease subunit